MLGRRYLFAALCLLITAPACDYIRNIRQQERDKEAIQAAFHKYLAERSGIDLKNTDVDIQEFNTDRNRAELVVKFTPKQGGAGMRMQYVLEREGETWVVKSSAPLVGGVPSGTAPQSPGTIASPHSGTGSGSTALANTIPSKRSPTASRKPPRR